MIFLCIAVVAPVSLLTFRKGYQIACKCIQPKVNFGEIHSNVLWTKSALQMNIWKIIYFNCGERYELMIDHQSYIHNLSSCEIKAWKENQAWLGFKPMTSAIPVQCSTNWAIKPSGSLPSFLTLFLATESKQKKMLAKHSIQ